jgi:hypothetical protein
MALVRFGGGIIGMSGSIAGNTFARNRFGNYVRSRTKPVNPRSTAQANVRTNLAFCTNRWHSFLVAGQRAGWDAYAAAVAMKNKLGDTTFITGFNHYIRSNVLRKIQLDTVVDAGPAILSLPEKPINFYVTPTVAGGLSVSFDIGQDWWDEPTGLLIVFMGQPQLKSRNYFAGPWKRVGAVSGTQESPKIFATPPYTIALNQKIWFYGRISRVDGRLSEPVVVSHIVAA